MIVMSIMTTSSNFSIKMEKLLLIDDDTVFVNILETELKKTEQTFQMDTCLSVNEAIRYLKKDEYGLVITDLKMPQKDGIELLNYLDKISYKGYTMMMSAYRMEDSLQKAKDFGIIDVIKKPFELDWFEDKIVEFFKSKNDSVEIFGDIDIALRNICRKICHSTSAKFEDVELLSLLQVINMDKRSASLNFTNGKNSGVIIFLNGNIVYVEYGDLIGETALLELMQIISFDILVKNFDKKMDRNIDKPFIELMRELVKKSKDLNANDEDKKNNRINDEKINPNKMLAKSNNELILTKKKIR